MLINIDRSTRICDHDRLSRLNPVHRDNLAAESGNSVVAVLY